MNVAAVYERPDEAAVYEPWVAGFAAALRQGDGGAYVNFLGDEVEAAGPRGLPGEDLGETRRDQGPLRPNQPLPAQPEHPAEAGRSYHRIG